MKSILNWISSSFFRTFGRVIAYIVIGFLIFVLLSKIDIKGLLFTRLNAQVIDNHYITYNYIDEKSIQLNTKSFFDENGSLEYIRKGLENANLNNAKYLIGFTIDDIIVVIDYNVNSEFYMFSEVYTTFDRILINSNTISGLSSTSSSRYYFKLSDYGNNLGNFLNGIITSDNKRHDYDFRNYYRFAYTTNVDLRNQSYNWWQYNTGYFIPYYTNTNLKNSCYGSGCSNSDVQNIPFKILNVTSYIPTYYSLYGYDLPNSNLVPNSIKVYKEFFLINKSNLDDNWSITTNFHYLLGNDLSVKEIRVYGLANINKVHYYTDITDSFSFSGYNFTCVSTTRDCTLNISNTNINHTTLDNYSKIYFDIVFNDFISIESGTFAKTYNNVGIQYVGINDISVSTLFLQQESSYKDTYAFFTNDFSNTQIFYNELVSNDYVFNEPSYIDLSTNNLNNNVDFSFGNYYIGKFNQIIFNDNVLSNSKGIIMNLYNNGKESLYNPTGIFQIIYFITPNLYWTNSVYTEDRNSVNTCNYVNNEVVCKDISGDFSNKYSQYTQVDSYFKDFKELLLIDKIGISDILIRPFQMLLDTINTSNNNRSICSNVSIPVPFTNTYIYLPCLSSIYNQYVPQIISIWHIVLYGVILLGLGFDLIKTIAEALDPDEKVAKEVGSWL